MKFVNGVYFSANRINKKSLLKKSNFKQNIVLLIIFQKVHLANNTQLYKQKNWIFRLGFSFYFVFIFDTQIYELSAKVLNSLQNVFTLKK